MRYRELITESQPEGQTFYHVTTDNRLKSIRAAGVEPGRNRRWKNPFGKTLGDRGYVYLISDFTEAVRFAHHLDYWNRIEKKRMKAIILKLRNVPTEGIMRDDNAQGNHSWFKSPETIPPEDIVREIPLTPELSKQAVAGRAQEPSVPEELG